MSTFKCSREIYQSASDSADSIRNEMKHYPDNDIGELIDQEAERQTIYTQDNWDVVNIMRCSDEMEVAEDMIDLSDYTIDGYMETAAAIIWHELIVAALQD